MIRRLKNILFEFIRQADLVLLSLCVISTLYGIVLISSATRYMGSSRSLRLLLVQTAAMGIGMVLYILFSILDMEDLIRKWKWMLAFNVGFICLLRTPFGVDDGTGNLAWLKFPGVPVSIQPAEIVKITLILVLAVMIANMGKKINEWRSWGIVSITFLPLALMVMMNNLSSGIIICGIAIVMMFVANKRKWPFVLFIVSVAAVILFAPTVAVALEEAGILQEYQLRRILVWKNPEAYPTDGGYQVLQGLYAIGSGGLLGKGLGQSIQKLSFLPEPQNDMIFAIICE